MTNAELDAQVERMLELPYWAIDFLPVQAPERAGNYAAVERYFLEPERVVPLRERLAHVLLRLNCYHDIWVCAGTDGWAHNPDPQTLVNLLSACVPAGDGPRWVNVLVGECDALLMLDAGDLYATLYGPSGSLLDLVPALAQTEGLCVWQPPQ